LTRHLLSGCSPRAAEDGGWSRKIGILLILKK